MSDLSDRELDALVARMLEPELPPFDPNCDGPSLDMPERSPNGAWLHVHIYDHGDECEWLPRAFSTDISAAMEVVEKIAPPKSARDSEFIRWFRATTCPSGWHVEFESGEAGGPYETAPAVNASLPRAICEAALAALSTVGEK